MTINTSRTREFTIGSLATMAYRLAGLLNEHQSLTEAKSVAARDLLETILDELQTHGLYARTVTFERVALAANANELTFPAYVFDVIGDAMHIDATEPNPDRATSEFVVSQIDRDTRQKVSSKAATGNPTMFYADRTGELVKAWVWPTPDASCFLRFQVHRMTADSNDATKTPDVERFWVQHLLWELAHQLAVSNSMSMPRIAHLATMAEKKLMAARAYANPRGSQQAVLDHRTAWSR